MATKKSKIKSDTKKTETGLLVVEPVVKRKNLLKSFRMVGVVAFVTVASISAFLTYKTASPLLKNRQIGVVASQVKLDPYQLVAHVKNRLAYVIIDTRDKQSYAKGHIRGAILSEQYKVTRGQKVLIYGHTQFDAEPGKLAQQLATKEVDVQVLAVGWNEFRHFSNLWVPEKSWNDFNISDFVEESL
ncbi:MAG: rhodanese-like domain-containing protein [Patescibacteria group bacterium]|jgi:hypothetical protein